MNVARIAVKRPRNGEVNPRARSGRRPAALRGLERKSGVRGPDAARCQPVSFRNDDDPAGDTATAKAIEGLVDLLQSTVSTTQRTRPDAASSRIADRSAREPTAERRYAPRSSRGRRQPAERFRWEANHDDRPPCGMEWSAAS